jgi:hypothetical protein
MEEELLHKLRKTLDAGITEEEQVVLPCDEFGVAAIRIRRSVRIVAALVRALPIGKAKLEAVQLDARTNSAARC